MLRPSCSDGAVLASARPSRRAGAIERNLVEGMAHLRPRPGGMRFSPLTEINTGQCRPAQSRVGLPHAAGRLRGSRARRRRAYGETPEGNAGRGRGRGGSGFLPSETTPLVIDGTMYLSTPYSRVVAIDPTTGKELWSFHLPTSSPSTRGSGILGRRCADAAADRLRRATASCIRSMPRPGSPTTLSATTASSI
jgi:hypothetical protein